MLYAADLFIVPPSRHCIGSKGTINKFARIQRQAALLITGALCATATNILDAHADLLPFLQLVSKLIHCTAIRLSCLPKSHPLAPHIKKAARSYVKKHKSPLHKIWHAFDLKPDHMEKIETIICGPKWSLTFPISIPKNKEEAVKAEKESKATLKVYSDRSAKDGGVSAAAVLYKNGKVMKVAKKSTWAAQTNTQCLRLSWWECQWVL
jgi:hypothetical protein